MTTDEHAAIVTDAERERVFPVRVRGAAGGPALPGCTHVLKRVEHALHVRTGGRAHRPPSGTGCKLTTNCRRHSRHRIKSSGVAGRFAAARMLSSASCKRAAIS